MGGFNKMKPLPLILKKNGFTYTQVLRNDKVCIYRQEVAENLNYFEVFTVQIKPQALFKGKLIPEREVFPGDEDFGKTWSCRTFDEAEVRFKKLVEKQSQKNTGTID
jgi:hypothetical protein